MAVHEARVTGQQRVRIETDPGQGVGADIGDEYIGPIEQFEGQFLSLVHGQVDDNAPLAAVVEFEHGVVGHVAAEHPLEASRRIAARWLDLDDVGTPVGQNASGSRAGHPHAQLHNTNSGHRPCHASAFRCDPPGSVDRGPRRAGVQASEQQRWSKRKGSEPHFVQVSAIGGRCRLL